MLQLVHCFVPLNAILKIKLRLNSCDKFNKVYSLVCQLAVTKLGSSI